MRYTLLYNVLHLVGIDLIVDIIYSIKSSPIQCSLPLHHRDDFSEIILYILAPILFVTFSYMFKFSLERLEGIYILRLVFRAELNLSSLFNAVFHFIVEMTSEKSYSIY